MQQDKIPEAAFLSLFSVTRPRAFVKTLLGPLRKASAPLTLNSLGKRSAPAYGTKARHPCLRALDTDDRGHLQTVNCKNQQLSHTSSATPYHWCTTLVTLIWRV